MIIVSDLHCNIYKLKSILHLNYNLGVTIIDRLEFGYLIKLRTNGDTNWARIEDDGKTQLATKIRKNNGSNSPN